MKTRAYLIQSQDGDAVTLEYNRATAYAAQNHGIVGELVLRADVAAQAQQAGEVVAWCLGNPLHADSSNVFLAHEFSPDGEHIDEWTPLYTTPPVPAQPAAQPDATDSDAWMGDVIRDIAELPDRTSPEDQPEMMLVSARELLRAMKGRVPQAAQAVQGVPEGWKLVDNKDSSITVSTPAGGCVTLWRTGQGSVESIAYRLAQMLLTAYPTPPAQQPAGDVVRDAERYRFLAERCRSASEHWRGRWWIVIDGPAPKSHDSEDDFDAAIDAAMASSARKGE